MLPALPRSPAKKNPAEKRHILAGKNLHRCVERARRSIRGARGGGRWCAPVSISNRQHSISRGAGAKRRRRPEWGCAPAASSPDFITRATLRRAADFIPESPRALFDYRAAARVCRARYEPGGRGRGILVKAARAGGEQRCEASDAELRNAGATDCAARQWLVYTRALIP